MVLYHAVKLTRIGEDGKPNHRKRTFGLIESVMVKDDCSFRDSFRMKHHLEQTNISPKKLGMIYAGNFANEYYASSDLDMSLSFDAPCDLIIRNPEPEHTKIYKVEKLPIESQIDFQKGVLDELLEGNY